MQFIDKHAGLRRRQGSRQAGTEDEPVQSKTGQSEKNVLELAWNKYHGNPLIPVMFLMCGGQRRRIDRPDFD
jgi:hypothetical protein